MKLLRATLIVLSIVVTVAVPAAFADKPPSTPSTTTTAAAADQPGPKAPLPAQAKAYGRYCQNQSKKHVPGQKGTPFSQCVTAMAKAAHGQSPTVACAALSKKHVPGEKGTPFSRCVVAAAHLRRDRQQHP